MQRLVPICAIVAAMTVAVVAQDTKVKSRTTVKADDATVVNLTGCLRQAGPNRSIADEERNRERPRTVSTPSSR